MDVRCCKRHAVAMAEVVIALSPPATVTPELRAWIRQRPNGGRAVLTRRRGRESDAGTLLLRVDLADRPGASAEEELTELMTDLRLLGLRPVLNRSRLSDVMAGEPQGRRRSLNEAAHRGGMVSPAGASGTTGIRRQFNDAAHKLGHWPVAPAEPADASPEPPAALVDDERDVVANAGRLVLALGALGVVYGDIGTSPLYTEQVIFSQHSDAAHATAAGVYGIVSLIFWALATHRLRQVRPATDAGAQPR